MGGFPPRPHFASGTAAGLADPVSQQTCVLASGAGEMPIVSGSRGSVFEIDPMLQKVIRSCHPTPGAAVPLVAQTEDGDEVDPVKAAPADS